MYIYSNHVEVPKNVHLRCTPSESRDFHYIGFETKIRKANVYETLHHRIRKKQTLTNMEKYLELISSISLK